MNTYYLREKPKKPSRTDKGVQTDSRWFNPWICSSQVPCSLPWASVPVPGSQRCKEMNLSSSVQRDALFLIATRPRACVCFDIYFFLPRNVFQVSPGSASRIVTGHLIGSCGRQKIHNPCPAVSKPNVVLAWTVSLLLLRSVFSISTGSG